MCSGDLTINKTQKKLNLDCPLPKVMSWVYILKLGNPYSFTCTNKIYPNSLLTNSIWKNIYIYIFSICPNSIVCNPNSNLPKQVHQEKKH